MGKSNSKLSPQELSEYCVDTQFDIKDTARCHSTFSQKCPDGYIGREQFLSVFARYFPFGDSVPFANLLFRHYDSDGEGRILFRRFLQVLSLSARARLEEKIKWAFSFYDQDQDGVLSRADLAIVFDAVHRLVGGVPTTPALLAMKSTNSLSDYYRAENQEVGDHDCPPPLDSRDDEGNWISPGALVDITFNRMAKETNMFISYEEFRAGIHDNPAMLQALLIFDGVC